MRERVRHAENPLSSCNQLSERKRTFMTKCIDEIPFPADYCSRGGHFDSRESFTFTEMIQLPNLTPRLDNHSSERTTLITFCRFRVFQVTLKYEKITAFRYSRRRGQMTSANDKVWQGRVTSHSSRFTHSWESTSSTFKMSSVGISLSYCSKCLA
jgi:hypothetical protein